MAFRIYPLTNDVAQKGRYSTDKTWAQKRQKDIVTETFHECKL